MTPSADRRSDTEKDQIGGILIIGDDPVGSNISRALALTDTVIFIVDGSHFSNRIEEHTPEVIKASHPAEFIGETSIIPDSAIVATSQDTQNLLFVQHLRLEFDIEEIVVRVNNPQNIDAYADLPVTVVDAADIVASALVQQLEQSNNPR